MTRLPESTSFGPGDVLPGASRGAAGFFRLEKHAGGQWWLVDPAGHPCFLRAVHGVEREPPSIDRVGAPDPAVRLRTWRFNAAGCGSDPTLQEDGLPFVAVADFVSSAPQVVGPGVKLPDVFDPDWPRVAAKRAEAVCEPLLGCRELVGWVSDDALAWGDATRPERPGLLQLCLSLEPSYPAYHAAWEFALATQGGSLDALSRAWGVSIRHKEVVRELSRADAALQSRGFARVNAQWTREFARRYFTTTSSAIRAVDASHLLLGCRFREPAGPEVLAGLAAAQLDAPLIHWSETPPPSAAASPLLAESVGWAEDHPAGVAGSPGRLRLTSIERMLRRGRGALQRLARHPAVVGYVWTAWRDAAGEQPPFARGLVHLNGAEAREHTELLADFNGRAEALRRASAKHLTT